MDDNCDLERSIAEDKETEYRKKCIEFGEALLLSIDTIIHNLNRKAIFNKLPISIPIDIRYNRNRRTITSDKYKYYNYIKTEWLPIGTVGFINADDINTIKNSYNDFKYFIKKESLSIPTFDSIYKKVVTRMGFSPTE